MRGKKRKTQQTDLGKTGVSESGGLALTSYRVFEKFQNLLMLQLSLYKSGK